MDAIFSLTCASMHESKLLLLYHVALFVNLLRSAPYLEDDVKLEISKKLEWGLSILIDEDVYSSIIALPLPLLHGSDYAIIDQLCTLMKTTDSWESVLDSDRVGKGAFQFPDYTLTNGNPSSVNIKLHCGRIQLQAGNLVKEILLKLNLPDHRFIQRWCVQDKAYQGRLFNSFQDEVKYEHVGLKVTRLQEGKELQICSSADAR
ncbi:RNA polymerase II assembly factor like protein [Tanacetum coccineum]